MDKWLALKVDHIEKPDLRIDKIEIRFLRIDKIESLI